MPQSSSWVSTLSQECQGSLGASCREAAFISPCLSQFIQHFLECFPGVSLFSRVSWQGVPRTGVEPQGMSEAGSAWGAPAHSQPPLWVLRKIFSRHRCSPGPCRYSDPRGPWWSWPGAPPPNRVLWFPPRPLPPATALAQPGPAAHQGAAEIAVSAPGGARKSACLLAE